MDELLQVTETPVATHSQIPDLTRHIGLQAAVLLVIGNVIGSGIFMTSGLMLQRMPSASLLILAWVLGGVLALCGGLTYAEMGGMFPRSGGIYIFLREAYGLMPAFLFGWTCLVVILTGQIAGIAVGFSEYFSYFFPYLSSSHVLFSGHFFDRAFSVTANKLVAVTAIVGLGIVNYFSAKVGNKLNVTLTIAKIVGIASLPTLAVLYTKARPAWHPIVAPGFTHVGAAFGLSMIGVLWAYDGWQYVPFAAGEIRDARRNVPRALIWGVAICVTIFVAVNLAYLYALSGKEMMGVVRVGEKAATALGGPRAGYFTSLAVLTSTLGCCAAMMLVCTRLFFAMGADGVFFSKAGAIHKKYGTPYIAVALTTCIAALFAMSGSYEQLYTYVIFGGLLFAVLGGVAVFVLRVKRPDIVRTYRVWGYPVVPAVFILGTVMLVANTLFQKPVESLIGLGLVFLGLPAYLFWRKPARSS
jgi:APA family basic amino acid/polyamine antiporter